MWFIECQNITIAQIIYFCLICLFSHPASSIQSHNTYEIVDNNYSKEISRSPCDSEYHSPGK